MARHGSTPQQTNVCRTSRRSWLASLTAGIAAFASFSAWAHDPKSETSAKARSFADLSKAQATILVKRIDYRSGAYRVWTADGACAEFAAADLRFAIDASTVGPAPGKPVLWPSGHSRDRALVFFSAPNEIGAFIIASS